MTTRKNAKQTFEDDLRRMEEIVSSLEEGTVPLDRAVELYEEGLALSKACAERLRATELRIKKLSKDLEGQFQLQELNDE